MLAAEFKQTHGIELTGDAVALQRLKEAAERAKIELSSAMSTDLNLPFLAVGPTGPVHLQRDLTRGELENLCKGLLGRLEGPCREALRLAHCTAADIDQVLLVGGMTRMPAVQERVIEIFGKEPSGVNPTRDRGHGRRRHRRRRAAGGHPARYAHSALGKLSSDPGEIRHDRGQPGLPHRGRRRRASDTRGPVRARRSADPGGSAACGCRSRWTSTCWP
jgi:hypothetical protein